MVLVVSYIRQLCRFALFSLVIFFLVTLVNYTSGFVNSYLFVGV